MNQVDTIQQLTKELPVEKKEAFEKLKNELEQDDSAFAQKSLHCLEELDKEYDRYYYSKQ